MKLFTKRLVSAERGQAILLIALAMVALAAFVGLMTDVGVMFIEYGKLKRGIDAGAIAAAQQFRRDFAGEDLAAAARNFLTLNQTTADNISIFRCKEVLVSGTWVIDTTADGTMHDATLCATPPAPRRKLIRVEAERTINFSFLRVIGIPGTTIRASSVGEAASIDLVLVIDTSSSMSYETGGDPTKPDDPLDDPSVCNVSPTNPCQPLTNVKNTAVQFLNTMFFPYDRVSVVATTSQVPDGTRDHTTVLQLSDNPTAVADAINSLKVFQPPACADPNPATGFCLNHDGSGNFIGLDCMAFWYTGDPSSCPSSNLGGALWRASASFVEPGFKRDESLWVIILLAGGPANATDPDVANGKPYGYCPASTWNTSGVPWCRDASAVSRHSLTDANTSDDAEYDADDYARDQADFIADPVDGQGITIFTIGLGEFVRNTAAGDPDAGEQLLRYVAETAGDSTASPPEYIANHGFYSYTPDTAGLSAIFSRIAENIFTRIAQ